MPFTFTYANQILNDSLVENPAYMSLHSGSPTLANELVGLSYRRQLIEFGVPNGYTLSTNTVSFGPLAANSTGVMYVAIWDSMSEGTCMYQEQIATEITAIPINTGDTIDWGVGEITINVFGG